jgi:hypothetical protein
MKLDSAEKLCEFCLKNVRSTASKDLPFIGLPSRSLKQLKEGPNSIRFARAVPGDPVAAAGVDCGGSDGSRRGV